MAFYEAARQYDKEALRLIASVMMDAKQPTSLRLAAANDLLDRVYGRPPIAVQVDEMSREPAPKRVIEVRWMSADPRVLERRDPAPIA
jgi:hypothetical protein